MTQRWFIVCNYRDNKVVFIHSLVVDEQSPAGPLQQSEDQEDGQQGQGDENVVAPMLRYVHGRAGEGGSVKTGMDFRKIVFPVSRLRTVDAIRQLVYPQQEDT